MFEPARTTRKRAHRAQPRAVWVPALDLDFEWARRFLQARMVPAVEMITPDGLERVVWLDSIGRRAASARPVRLTIQYEPQGRGNAAGTGTGGRISISSVPAVPAAALRAAVIRMFDLNADVSTFLSLARRDSLLGPVVAANPRGLRLVQLLDPFEALLRAILGQQVSVAAASTTCVVSNTTGCGHFRSVWMRMAGG